MWGDDRAGAGGGDVGLTDELFGIAHTDLPGEELAEEEVARLGTNIV